jgi:hypothetical protein
MNTGHRGVMGDPLDFSRSTTVHTIPWQILFVPTGSVTTERPAGTVMSHLKRPCMMLHARIAAASGRWYGPRPPFSTCLFAFVLLMVPTLDSGMSGAECGHGPLPLQGCGQSTLPIYLGSKESGSIMSCFQLAAMWDGAIRGTRQCDRWPGGG